MAVVSMQLYIQGYEALTFSDSLTFPQPDARAATTTTHSSRRLLRGCAPTHSCQYSADYQQHLGGLRRSVCLKTRPRKEGEKRISALH